MADSLSKKVAGTKASLQNQTRVKTYTVEERTPKKGPGRDFKDSVKKSAKLHGYT